ncbi:unannotated protein [freshwater metagenome]|uniref:Unannotated protein n=1 Tax=freshwater metagenome TaxID=449393 RepID=A0A6J6E7I5_9ZZZZ
MPRTEDIPIRMASTPCESRSWVTVATSDDVLMSGVWTTTPCRRASRTKVCEDQKPIGCEFSNAVQNIAGSYNLIHAEAYTKYAKLTE